ncbi:basic phospholipase A2 Ceg-N6-like isoform X2 [Varanus komodoensis]|uniref:basic phospholipase A2 Ceg-N6-like isoform X2 n=1 Tax=Varanus komodoensis TaxID=61221 RepID=UPI001CF7BE14|nr:basic phospholipase A2 Ceg-N6-like isoform X2 [Varanus komodoensis]
MRQLLWVIILGASALSVGNGSLLHFKAMIETITQENALIFFNGYGCYCGKSGRGKPRDETDQCCYHHGCCYEDLHEQGCHPHIDHYSYAIIHRDVFCKYRNKSTCGMWACECDRKASLCFRKQAQTYNKKLRHYPILLCKESTPKCSQDEKPQDRLPKAQTRKPLSQGTHGGSPAQQKPRTTPPQKGRVA